MVENKGRISTRTIMTLFLLLLLTILFYWKILLTRQFSLLLWEEPSRQWYPWFNFVVTSIKQGVLPLWDPYTAMGNSFSGEMQTGAFSPLNLLFALIPLDRYGLVSPQSYHHLYGFVHFLGACFMFALVRQLGLSRFSALIAGICFSFGGFVGHAGWRHMYESAIWLPMIFFFLLRSFDAQTLKKTLLYASAGGLGLGLAFLGGGLHIVIMQAICIITAVIYYAVHSKNQADSYRYKSLKKPVLICAAVLFAGLCAGAIQIFPSMEYSSQALRWVGGDAPPMMANQKIPYAYAKDSLAPQSFLGMLISPAFRGRGEGINPYIGVFALFAAIIGIMKCWSHLWVRYLSGLALFSFLYSLGDLSIVHGTLYTIVPRLWMVREAGRFIYLASFAMPILAAFGIETLLHAPAQKISWTGVNRFFSGIAIVCGAALVFSALFERLEINMWAACSIMMILASYGLFHYILRGRTGVHAQALIVILILFDIGIFNWEQRNKIEEAASNKVNHLDRLISCRGAMNFLKSKPAPYRVKIDGDPKPNIGHTFQVPTIDTTGVTMQKNFEALSGTIPNLLNIRYILRPSSAGEPGFLYQDAAWKVYENPDSFPAAWIVHETMIEPSVEGFRSRVDAKEIDFNKTAVLSAPLQTSLEPRIEGLPEKAAFRAYKANRLELDVQTQSRGLLVLSESFYPGWRVTVNGKSEKIYKVNGILRGIVAPKGYSRIVLQYAPVSILAGGLLSLLAFSGTLIAFAMHWRKRDSSM